MIRYNYLKEFNLIIEKHTGLIQLELLVESMESLKRKGQLSDDADFLIDIRKSVFSRDIGKVRNFVSYLSKNFSGVLRNKIAFVTEESDQVAMATLFKMLQSNKARNIQVFSSLEYVLLWLNVDTSIENIEEAIKSSEMLIPIN